MNKSDIIKHWEDGSDRDYEVMKHLYEKKDYSWSLFLGHLVIEKLLKAYYVKFIDNKPVISHDLLRIAEMAKLKLSEEQQLIFATLTTFNINARYDDYKNEFYKLCTKEYATGWINKIEIIRTWIKEKLSK